MRRPINAILLILATVLLVPVASYAAGLGTLTVRSALGQPLDAEIEVFSLRRGEETFQVRLASRDAYQNAGMEASPALNSVRFAVEHRNGRTFVRIRTTQPVNDPYLNLFVELHFPTGRLARQYTVLVDPLEYKFASTPAPSTPIAVAPVESPAPTATRAPVAAAPVETPAPAAAPSIAAAPVVAAPAETPAPAAQPAPVAAAPVETPAPAPAPARVAAAPVETPTPVAAPAPVAAAPVETRTPVAALAPAAAAPVQTPVRVDEPARVAVTPVATPRAAAPLTSPVVTSAPTAAANAETYLIQRGDTLGAIARKWRHDGVTIPQMLIGLYKLNPEVFIRDNINLIRAGATLLIPGRQDVLAVRNADAVREVRIQMAEFSKYRRTYAAGAGGSRQSLQAQRDMVNRRSTVAKKNTRSM